MAPRLKSMKKQVDIQALKSTVGRTDKRQRNSSMRARPMCQATSMNRKQ